jgi:phosphoserine phosphatase RsbX
MTLEIAHLTSPAHGEVSSGDAVVIRRHEDATLLAVVDVLGHGGEAAKVARTAVAFLERAPFDAAADLLLGLHAALRGTRGAAASICVVRGQHLQGCGIGNVEIRVLGSPLGILLTPGIVGQHHASLRRFEGSLAPGDRLVCFSDGISSRVPLGELRPLAPRDACAVMMRQHRRNHDDASVVVADVPEARDRREVS